MRQKYSDETIATARRMYVEGIPRNRISAELGISYSTINRWVVPGFREAEYARLARQREEYVTPDRVDPAKDRPMADMIGINNRIAAHRTRIRSSCSR